MSNSLNLGGSLQGTIDNMLTGNVAGNISFAGGTPPVIQEKNITANGTYAAPSGVDGFSPVVVNVPSKIEGTLIATENGTFTPEDTNHVWNEAIIEVPERIPVIQEKNITANGIYTVPSGVDGYSPINVSVPIPEPNLTQLEATSNGTYLPQLGYAGFDEVIVNVPIPQSIGIVLANKYPIVNNRTLQPVPVTLTQGKYYAVYYYDDYLYPRANNVLGCAAFSRTVSGSTEERFFMNYWNMSKDWYCTDSSIYLKTKFDNDAVYSYVTVIEIDNSIISQLIPS